MNPSREYEKNPELAAAVRQGTLSQDEAEFWATTATRARFQKPLQEKGMDALKRIAQTNLIQSPRKRFLPPKKTIQPTRKTQPPVKPKPPVKPQKTAQDPTPPAGVSREEIAKLLKLIPRKRAVAFILKKRTPDQIRGIIRDLSSGARNPKTLSRNYSKTPEKRSRRIQQRKRRR
ncbi:MAG: hypothetical protein J4215_01050 [Candidatus Diapherotrites archaeon]|uniref:Uncharacterized protein n=1 Tax=Candidatus Iainarchaeum sp. TaxID=3101447 RepID=A0A8T4L303_9ARCH|nr:hypothetical protein [Candidatus Diapherotrites archaeon]